MKCSFIPQFIILVALGLGAGFIHSLVAPVKLAVDTPSNPLDAVKNAPKRTTPIGARPAPANPDPTPSATSDPAPSTDTPTPASSNPAASTPAHDGTVTPPASSTPAPPAPAPNAAPQTPAPAGEEVLSQALRDKGHITVKEAYELFKSNTAYFIDTRKKAEYEEGHVQDAFGIPLSAFLGKTPKLIDAIDRSSPIVCYCIGGNCDESEEVAKNFNLMGYKNVYIMHAGFPGWKAAGYPIQTGPGIQEQE